MAAHWAAPIVGVICLVAAMEFLPDDLRALPNFYIHALMTFIVVTLAIQERNPFSPFLTNPLVSRIGAISYGIYLYHLLALDVTNRAFAMLGISNPWLLLIGYSVLACIITDVSFKTLEAYFRRFRP